MNALIGTCEQCRQIAPMYVVPTGALREPYLCEVCAKRAVASGRLECGRIIRDGQTTIGACQRELGHGGEHQRGAPVEPEPFEVDGVRYLTDEESQRQD